MNPSRLYASLTVSICALAMLPGAASAARHHKAKHRAAAFDTVKGDGSINQLGVLKAHLVIDAKSDANGTHPSGHVSAESLLGGVPITFDGAVTCMKVTGNQAVVKYDFANASPSVLKGGGIEIFIKDAGLGLQDYVGFISPQDPLTWKLAGPHRCDPLFLAPFGVVTGDFKISDG